MSIVRFIYWVIIVHMGIKDMKKIIPILIVGALVLSGIGAIAI